MKKLVIDNEGKAIDLDALLGTDACKSIGKIAQVVPREMLIQLKDAAQIKEISLDLEVISRLVATFLEPNAFGFSPLLNNILNKKLAAKEIAEEAKQRRKAWAYIYEKDKLRLLIDYEDLLPEGFQETFNIIDVEAEGKILRAEKKAGGGGKK